jgi:hypothetical protein
MQKGKYLLQRLHHMTICDPKVTTKKLSFKKPPNI